MMKRVWQVLVFVLFTDEEVGVVLEVSRLERGYQHFYGFLLCDFYDSMDKKFAAPAEEKAFPGRSHERCG